MGKHIIEPPIGIRTLFTPIGAVALIRGSQSGSEGVKESYKDYLKTLYTLFICLATNNPIGYREYF
jgi:hypothetical protein